VGNFSHRQGFRAHRPITVREDAPRALRAGLVGILSDMGHSYASMRELICPVRHEFPDPNNWTEIPNVRDEVLGLVQECDWFRQAHPEVNVGTCRATWLSGHCRANLGCGLIWP